MSSRWSRCPIDAVKEAWTWWILLRYGPAVERRRWGHRRYSTIVVWATVDRWEIVELPSTYTQRGHRQLL